MSGGGDKTKSMDQLLASIRQIINNAETDPAAAARSGDAATGGDLGGGDGGHGGGLGGAGQQDYGGGDSYVPRTNDNRSWEEYVDPEEDDADDDDDDGELILGPSMQPAGEPDQPDETADADDDGDDDEDGGALVLGAPSPADDGPADFDGDNEADDEAGDDDAPELALTVGLAQEDVPPLASIWSRRGAVAPDDDTGDDAGDDAGTAASGTDDDDDDEGDELVLGAPEVVAPDAPADRPFGEPEEAEYTEDPDDIMPVSPAGNGGRRRIDFSGRAAAAFGAQADGPGAVADEDDEDDADVLSSLPDADAEDGRDVEPEVAERDDVARPPVSASGGGVDLLSDPDPDDDVEIWSANYDPLTGETQTDEPRALGENADFAVFRRPRAEGPETASGRLSGGGLSYTARRSAPADDDEFEELESLPADDEVETEAEMDVETEGVPVDESFVEGDVASFVDNAPPVAAAAAAAAAPAAAAPPPAPSISREEIEQIVRQVLRQELLGDVGRKISENVQRMVHDEIAKIMGEAEPD